MVKVSNHDFFVHRIVALAFLGPPPDDLTWQVHHRDGNKANNRFGQLGIYYSEPKHPCLLCKPLEAFWGN